jgi:hypothetical protein
MLRSVNTMITMEWRVLTTRVKVHKYFNIVFECTLNILDFAVTLNRKFVLTTLFTV